MWDPNTSNNQAAAAAGKHDKLEEDSGQIDSGFLSSEQILQSFSEDIADEPSPAPVPAIHKQAPEEDTKQQQLESTYLDSGLVEDAEFLSGNQQEMLLERELDNGLSEWLCTLDLKNNSQSAAQINNLSRKMDSATASMDQLNINEVKKKQHEKLEKQAQILEMPDEIQPWEMFYKQDAEGDT